MCHHICYYVPPHMLANIAKAKAMDRRREGAAPGHEQRSAVLSDLLRQRRKQASFVTPTPPPAAAAKGTAHKAVAGVTIPPANTHSRLIYDDQNQENFDVQLIRGEGDPAVAQNADLAYDALGATLDFYRTLLGRDSIDNLGLNLVANVNFGVNYDNAFWDGTRMVFGNGDNVIFQDFTNDVDVPGHELTHGVTQYTAGLQYTDQPGALNEATSDIFGACIDARVNGKDAGSFNWLIARWRIPGPPMTTQSSVRIPNRPLWPGTCPAVTLTSTPGLSTAGST
jgi:hypothetical protein